MVSSVFAFGTESLGCAVKWYSLKLMCDSLAGLLDSISYCNNNGDLMRGSTQ